MLKLDGLSLSGFKSFADRTEVVFPEGITCVVGPNGCGKSNIVDAIAWVLGEQRASLLRGAKMEEVIFAGSRSRKPAGMAEVTLRFSPRDAATPEGAEPVDAVVAGEPVHVDPRLSEALTITRRLYRNGDSEYLINDERARLKDITQLIMGTGMGTRVYSIIEQGRVGQILNSKPTDRRILIEEAAGITLYKARRKAARLKLDEAEQGLLRVTDIVGELDRQRRSLKRQVGTARRYKRLAGRRRVVLRALHAVQHRDLSAKLGDCNGDLDRLQALSSESGRALGALEESTRAAREHVAELEARRDVVSQHSHGMHLELQGARHVIESARQRLVDLAGRLATTEESRARLRAECEQLERQRDEQLGRLKALEEDLALAGSRTEDCATGTRTVRQRLAETHRTIAETKEGIFEVMSEAAGLRNRKQEIESAVSRLEAQVARLAGALAEGEAELDRVSTELAQGQARLEAALAEQRALALAAAEVAGRLETATHAAQRCAEEHESRRRELDESEWQLAAVAETVRSRAAWGEGVRRVLAEPPPGVLGAVADFVTVRRGDELASEKALGRFLQAVVVESREAAEKLAQSLTSRQSAEIDLVFPDREIDGADRSRPQPADRRIAGALSESLTFDDDATSWLSRLVPPGWLVATAKDAVALARKFPDDVFVSRDGVLLGPGGQGSAGRPLGEGDGILETRARHDSLRASVDERRASAQDAAAALDAADAERARLSLEREHLQGDLGDAERRALAERHAVAGLRQAVDAAQARSSVARIEHESASRDLAEASGRMEDLGLRLAHATTAKADLDRKLVKADELAARLEAEVEGADAELSRLREELAVKAERREGAVAEAARLEQEVRRRAASRDEVAAQADALALERTETERLVAQTEDAVASGSDRWESLKAELEDVEHRVRDGRTSLLEGAERLRDLRLEHERRARLATECEVRRERLVTELEHGVADCREKLGVEPEELPVPEPPSEDAVAAVAAEDAVAVEAEAAGVAEESAAADAEEDLVPEAPIDETLPWVDGVLDLARVAAEAEALRKKLDRIGPVNLVAIEEYDSLCERHGFLSHEQADLVESIRSLRATIAEIDELSRERFAEAFEAIRVSFDSAFQTLFRGGRAELRLQDEGDPLECGIEIIAQPPGKRLQNMLLLSGGEKALSAIALLFALFRYKPSPFCVLDEVDAPLDESNVLRFLDLVGELSRDTQFVLITHDRRSMERGNVLYGVTMQEPGCSKLVAVRFDGLDKESAA